MQLHCPNCRSSIVADGINLNLLVAKCASCSNVFSFADDLDLSVADKPQVDQPKRFRVENWGPDLTIAYRWYTHAVWVLVFFCVIWDGFIVGFYSSVIAGLSDGKVETMDVVALVFPILHVLIGLALTYACIATLLNKTTIRIGGHQLTISSGPVPCGKAILLQAADIRQLYCVKKEHRHKRSTSYTYELNALLRDGVSKTLIQSLTDYQQARFIEQQLESHLKIVDERVGEEVTSVAQEYADR